LGFEMAAVRQPNLRRHDGKEEANLGKS